MTYHNYRQSPPVHDGVVVVTCDQCGCDVFRGRPDSANTISRRKREHERRSRVAAETWDWGSER